MSRASPSRYASRAGAYRRLGNSSGPAASPEQQWHNPSRQHRAQGGLDGQVSSWSLSFRHRSLACFVNHGRQGDFSRTCGTPPDLRCIMPPGGWYDFRDGRVVRPMKSPRHSIGRPDFCGEREVDGSKVVPAGWTRCVINCAGTWVWCRTSLSLSVIHAKTFARASRRCQGVDATHDSGLLRAVIAAVPRIPRFL